ncbi:hypothetical protein F53441_5418 [Fusarium austroafricanum]|uniref:Uncharacterized protein n=1 Tax=Fusarium austroafricanum TaxID=2364996 RepID=A0A8H4NUH7_9HYPO|nr:hypothetical protein F53441_5418 [Fusarium austroafricanum]
MARRTSQQLVSVITGWKRVAWLSLLQRPVYITSECPSESHEAISEVIIDEARAILQKHDIPIEKEDDIKVTMRQNAHYGCEIPTLLIVSPWSLEKQNAWEKAVEDMGRVISDRMNKDHIYVEITSPELVQPIYFTSSEDPALNKTWDSVREMVYERLQSFYATKDQTSYIDLGMYGVNPDPKANAMTIYISVSDGSDETLWLKVITDIKSKLESVGWGHVQVHMEHDAAWPWR